MFRKYLSLIVLVVFAAGCGVKAQTYVMTKERVDQEIDGNAGCLSGECASAPAPEKKTRKVYVLEVTKALPESQIKKIEEEIMSSSVTVNEPQQEVAMDQEIVPASAPQKRRAVVIPPIEDELASLDKVEEAPQGPTEDQTYTVLKDDTLQKIAKKFYGSFGKWYRIYEANKEVIKDPNLVKPGTVITIPAVK